MDLAALNGRRILVVEDDYLIAQDVRCELERAGATVIGPVPSVDGALRILQQQPRPDAAVLDVNLGTMTSLPIAEVLERLSIPFVFVTGYNSADIPARWQQATIVTKPLRIDAVMRLIVGGET